MELFAKIVNGIKHKKPYTSDWVLNTSLETYLKWFPHEQTSWNAIKFCLLCNQTFFKKKQHTFDHDQTGRSFFKKTIALANKQIFEKTTFCMPIFNDIIWDAFKNREKHPWSRVTFNKVAELLLAKCQPKAFNFVISNTPSWVFFTFFILSKWY